MATVIDDVLDAPASATTTKSERRIVTGPLVQLEGGKVIARLDGIFPPVEGRPNYQISVRLPNVDGIICQASIPVEPEEFSEEWGRGDLIGLDGNFEPLLASGGKHRYTAGTEDGHFQYPIFEFSGTWAWLKCGRPKIFAGTHEAALSHWDVTKD